MAIYFYVPADEHGYLSNFSQHGFAVEGVYWPTVEHFFQGQKSLDANERDHIGRARSAKEAKARGRAVRLRPDWEEIKEVAMITGLREKFQAHPDIATRLVATGEETLVEAAPGDYYWGAGADGTGKNRLGVLLMQVRSELSASSQAT